MGKTLFWYIFKDLLKIFLLASGGLAGIMSFAGLLRPLSQHSLALKQVAEMLLYFLPAMTNYSWPIAALLATTFVYGRLSADNELTACRAAGVSYWAMMLPAAVLGLLVSGLSLFFLFFVVPESFMKAERVVYSNLAQFISNRIAQTQRIIFDSADQKVTVFAREAHVLEPDPAKPRFQAVSLTDVDIVTYRKDTDRGEPLMPQDFYIARSSIAYIEMPETADGDVMLTARLTSGAKIPRNAGERGSGAIQARISAQDFGPYPLPSPVRETTRFMDFYRLQELRANPAKGKRIAATLKELVRVDQKLAFTDELFAQLTTGDRTIRLAAVDGSYTITAGPKRPENRGGKIVIVSGNAENPGIRFVQDTRIDPYEAQVRQITLEALADPDSQRMFLAIELQDAVVLMGEEKTQRQNLERRIVVPMPASVAGLSQRPFKEYLDTNWLSQDRRDRLRADLARQTNQVESELNSRVSFAFSCLVLVLVGGVIGMLFKSGNFVSAFAISSIPAMVSLVLNVTGQHLADGVPRTLPAGFENPLTLGLQLIWGGNALVMAIGVVLYIKLTRT